LYVPRGNRWAHVLTIVVVAAAIASGRAVASLIAVMITGFRAVVHEPEIMTRPVVLARRQPMAPPAAVRRR
jgi:hypothetical protein